MSDAHRFANMATIMCEIMIEQNEYLHALLEKLDGIGELPPVAPSTSVGTTSKKKAPTRRGSRV